MPLAEILAAVATESADENACPWQSVQVEASALESLLAQVQDWGPLRAVVRSEAGAVVELLLHSDALNLAAQDKAKSARWLNLVTPHFHLHVNWSAVTQGWVLGHNGHLHSASFFDRHGARILSLQLRKVDGTFDFSQRFSRDELASLLPLVPVETTVESSAGEDTDE